MTERRDETSAATTSSPGDGASLLASGGLVFAILGIVVLTALLRTEPRRPEAPPAVEAEPAPTEAMAATATPEETAPPELPPARPVPPPEPPPDPRLAALAARAERDLSRLAGIPDRWTAQLIVAKDPASVERLVRASKGDQRLYVLPAEEGGEPRFRVCWGVYRNSKEASAAADLPATLRSREKPIAKPVAKVLPS